VLPSPSPAPPSAPDLVVRLRVVGEGIARSASAGDWPGSGPMDDRLLEIARNLSRAADLVERYGQDVQPTDAEKRADIAAAHARTVHTLYMGAHATAVALGEYAKDLRRRLCVDTHRRRRLELRPNAREIEPAEAMLSRFEVFEQIAAGYVAAHPVTSTVLGEVRPAPPTSRLQSALTAWDIQVHRTLASRTDAADLVRVGRVQALIASAAAVVTQAAGEKREIDLKMVKRLTATLDASQVAWSRLAKRWGELTSQNSRPDPALARAASEMRAAISATACTPTGWATPDQLASRLDLTRALKSLHLSMVSAVDVAHVAHEVAATHPALIAPARVIAMRAQGEAEIAREQGITAYDGATWAGSRQIAMNQLIPLPEPARRGLVNLASVVIATCNRAVAAAASLDPSNCATIKTPVDCGRKLPTAGAKKIPGAEPATRSHGDETGTSAPPATRGLPRCSRPYLVRRELADTADAEPGHHRPCRSSDQGTPRGHRSSNDWGRGLHKRANPATAATGSGTARAAPNPVVLPDGLEGHPSCIHVTILTWKPEAKPAGRPVGRPVARARLAKPAGIMISVSLASTCSASSESATVPSREDRLLRNGRSHRLLR
jgi:hypothetical protein